MSGTDPHHFDADPHPACHFDAKPNPVTDPGFQIKAQNPENVLN